ncbi:MAG: ATP-grasp domain-containing protein, partial [Thermoproteota archaeon]
MRIAVLTHKPYSYSSQRLLEEAGKMGVFCEIVLFKETAIMIKSNEVILKVFKEKGVEAVFSRPKTVLSQLMLYALSLTRIIEEEKFRVINPYDGYLNTIDKVITYKNLCSKGLPIPDSIASPCRKSLLEMEPPFFLKPIYGSRGRGIRLIGDVFLMPLEDSGVWVAQAPARDENWDLR